MRISTLITNYNYERYLEEAVCSVLSQTVPSHEVIVVDDGSTDGSRRIIEKLAAEHPSRVIPLFQENAGQGAAFNAAFAASTGDIILFLDSDDAWYAHKTASVLPALERTGFVQHNLLQNGKHYRSFLIASEHMRYMQSFGLFDFFVPTSGLCFRREVLEHFFPLPDNPLLRICADAYITRLALNYSELETISHARGVYRIHGANYWYTKRHRFPKRIVEILGIVNEFLDSRNLSRIPLERNWFVHGIEAAGTQESLEILQNMQLESRHTLPATMMEGWLHLSMRRYEKALDAFDRAMDVQGLTSSSDCSAAQDELQLLLSIARTGEGVNPSGFGFREAADTRHNMALCNVHLGRYEQALDAFEQASRLAPERLEPVQIRSFEEPDARNAADTHYNIAVCNVRLGRYERALEAFAQVLRFAPERLEIHLNRSDSLRYLGQFQEAFAEINMVEAIDPSFPGIEETRTKVRKAMTGTCATTTGSPAEQPREGSAPVSLNVQIQTTSRCNGKCVMCPYLDSWHKQNPGEMSDEVFERILAELTLRELNKICVYFENEPLMDPKIFRRLARIKETLRFKRLEISTNAALLNREKTEELAWLLEGTRHEIWVSFHGVDKHSYERIMGLDFDRSLGNLQHLLHVADQRGLRVIIRGSGMPVDSSLSHDTPFSREQFMTFWNARINEFGLSKRPGLNYFLYHDRSGAIRRNSIRLNRIPRPNLAGFRCPRIEDWLHFLYTGELCICCMDYHREHVLGDITTHSLDDILCGEKL